MGNLQFILRLSLAEKKFQKRMFTLRSHAVPRGWPMLLVLMAASVHGGYMIRDPDNPDSIIGSSTHETVWLRCSSCNTPQYYDLRFTESGPKALKAYTFEGENGTLWCVQKSKENAFLSNVWFSATHIMKPRIVLVCFHGLQTNECCPGRKPATQTGNKESAATTLTITVTRDGGARESELSHSTQIDPK